MKTQRVNGGLKVGSYDFTVQIVLLNHHYVDGPCILEREEPETTRSTRCAITHDSTFKNLSELGEVFL
jgi:hypothetical protein